MKAFMNWSGGKDSALCLFKAIQGGLPVEALVTTLSNDRVTMHGVRRELVEMQAASLNIPIHFIELGENGLEHYEACVRQMNALLKTEGFTHVISGDIFLEDLKAYREELYAKDNLECLFPLWGGSPQDIINEFFSLQFSAVVIAVNGELLNKDHCGRILDLDFISSLPPGVDICGEKGEYHSFVFDGPLFRAPVRFTRKDIVEKIYPRPVVDRECFKDPAPNMIFYFQELI